MSTNWVYQGRCWKFGDNIPTDALTPTHVMFKSPKEMAAFVLETVNPRFPKEVKPGDLLIAGRNFGCSSGRALATKALKATGIGAVVAEPGDYVSHYEVSSAASEAKRQAKRSTGSSMFVERRRPGLERRYESTLSLTIPPFAKR